MKVKDMEGRTFEIRDIEGTLKLIDGFLSYVRRQKRPSLKRLEDRRVQYWEDLREKLLSIKSRF